MTQDISRRLVFTSACLGMLMFGVVLTTLGAILPSIIDRFGVDMARAGTLFTLLSLGILVGSVLFGPIVDRYGYRSLLGVSAVLVLCSVEGIAYAVSFGWLQATVFVVGLSGGVINGGTNALVADISEDGRGAGLSMLGVFFGIGAFGMPFALSFLLDRFDYDQIIAGMGVLVLIPAGFFVLTRFPAPKQPHGFPLKEALGLVRDPVLLLFGLLLFLQSGLEITSSGWASTYFEQILGAGPGRAVLMLSFFWVGMVGARLALGIWLRRGRPARALYVSIAVALAGSLVMVSAGDPIGAGIGLLLMGAGLGAGFPVVLGFVGDRYPDLSGTAFSMVLVMALVGGSLLPYITGVVGENAGLRTAFLIIPAGLVGVGTVLTLALRRMEVDTSGRSDPPDTE